MWKQVYYFLVSALSACWSCFCYGPENYLPMGEVCSFYLKFGGLLLPMLMAPKNSKPSPYGDNISKTSLFNDICFLCSKGWEFGHEKVTFQLFPLNVTL